jgi:ABC-2 type transport system permease protein
MWRALGAIIARELKRMVRQRGRLISAMVRPLIWLLVIGTGVQTLIEGTGGGGYKHFLVPGLLSMVLLFGALLASLSLVYDKESGVMRMLVMAPFPHYWIILARTLSATLVGLTQAAMLMLILLPLGYWTAPESLPLLLIGLVLTSAACASLGIVIAVYSQSLDDFAVIMNFVIFPLFFLSGALYPLEQLPVALKLIALCNPFSYGVDLLKHALLHEAPPRFGSDFPVAYDLMVLTGFILITLFVACMRFSQARVLETLARLLSNPRRG